MKKKNLAVWIMTGAMMLMITGCGRTKMTSVDSTKNEEAKPTITIAAAASLEQSMTKEIIPLFEKKHPDVKIEGTYDSSGKLQTQIEEGAPIELFISAGEKQMDALVEKQLIAKDSVYDWLENHMVLIVPANGESKVTSFDTLLNAETIAVGDPESVPAGQYAKEILEGLGTWEKILDKSSLGTNVTEVLNWVAKGSAEAGIVYATDAMQTNEVKVVETAPEGKGSKAIYPVGLTTAGYKRDEAKEFEEFLKTDEVLSIIEKNGFTPIK